DSCIQRLLQMDKSFDSSKVEALLNSAMLHEDWRKLKNKIEKDRNHRNKTTIIFRLAASIVLIIAGSLGGLYLTRPGTYSLAKINPEVELKKLDTFRGSDPLSRGVFSLKNKDFNQANEIFMNYVHENPDNFEGHYYLGLTILFKAESGVYGFFRFRKSYAEKAVAHLQKALTRIDDNPRQAANCFWFIGKAYLMKGEIKPAESQFRKIVAISEPNIRRKQEAQALLQEIEKLRKRGV
ncbi:MAG: tetratricopeptide repeat protein, partial [bacterium]